MGNIMRRRRGLPPTKPHSACTSKQAECDQAKMKALKQREKVLKKAQARREFEAAIILSSIKTNWDFDQHAKRTKPRLPPASPKATRRPARRLPVPEPLGPPVPETRGGSLTILKLLKDPTGSVTPRRIAPNPRDRASSDSVLGLSRA